MKKNNPIFVLLFLLLLSACKDKPVQELAVALDFKSGDIIFQTSKSEQSEAIQLATESKYSHIGILYKDSNEYMVLEAVQPVKMTPLEDWIAQGENKDYVVKRLLGVVKTISEDDISKMEALGKSYLGKDYDPYFEWSNKAFYCSELVWKMYKKGLGIELCKTKKMKDFKLDNPKVAEKLNERYGDKIPQNQKVVSPADIFNSELLETIYSD